MKCVLMHQSITTHDAIGNDIANMYKVLGRNHDVCVYGNIILNKNLKSIDRYRVLELVKNEDNLIIYHHSNYWEEGEELFNLAKARIIVRYHCLTPPSFYHGWCEDYHFDCKMGSSQTRKFFEKQKEALWLCDSHYNLLDVGIDGFPNAIVVPPFNNLDQWLNMAPNEGILKALLENPVINLLFVGRFTPNKGHEMLLEVVRDYVAHYDRNIVLHMIGKKDSRLDTYIARIEDLVEGYGLEDNVNWVQEVDDSVLLSYYLGCDFYVNCSDHEGFCVPVIEAQSLCLPVIAKHACAVPETIGSEQVVLNEDPAEYSAAIRILSQEDFFRDHVVKMGLENYQNRFTNEIIERKFVKAVEDYTGVSL
jgi:glycosyltransferase involved in cell wall biosynthesis